MNSLTRLATPGLCAVLLLAGGFWTAAAGQGPVAGLRVTPVSDAAVTAPIRNAHGKVKSIVGRELTLDVGGHDMTFLVDEVPTCYPAVPGGRRGTRAVPSPSPTWCAPATSLACRTGS